MESQIDRKTLFRIIELIDSKLKGYTNKINIYCVGGTALTLIGKKYSSVDIDFLVSHEDFVAVSGITAEIQRKEDVTIDVGREFKLVEENFTYVLPSDYKDLSKKVRSFEHLDLYAVCDLDILITKALVGRGKDYDDIRDLVKKIDREEIMKRFEQYKFPVKIKNAFESKLKQHFGKS